MTLASSPLADPQQVVYLPSDGVRALLLAMLKKKSLFQYDAETVVARMLDADVRGVSFAGCRSILPMLTWMDQGDIDPRGRLLITRESAAAATIDGSSAAGAVAATKAMEVAITKALEVGIGAVTVQRSTPLTLPVLFASLAARQQLIGLCLTNTGPASLLAPGSHQPAAGESLWAVAASDGQRLLTIELSSAQCTRAEAAQFACCGLPLPSGVALDCEGHETCTATATTNYLAQGVLGVDLAVIGAILTGALSGGRLPYGRSGIAAEHLLLAIQPSFFGDGAAFTRKISALVDSLAALPSETCSATRALRLDLAAREVELAERGIPFHRADADALVAKATAMKLPVSW